MNDFKLGDAVIFIPSRVINKDTIKNNKLVIRIIESSIYSGQALIFYRLKGLYTATPFKLYTKLEYTEEL